MVSSSPEENKTNAAAHLNTASAEQRGIGLLGPNMGIPQSRQQGHAAPLAIRLLAKEASQRFSDTTHQVQSNTAQLSSHLVACPAGKEGAWCCSRHGGTPKAGSCWRERGSPAGLYFSIAHWFSLLSLALRHTPSTKDLTPGDYLKLETHHVGASLVTDTIPKPLLLLIMSVLPRGLFFFVCLHN